ncbi:putative transposase%2C truncation [Yersinia frederiksenii]|nr:putative transposase%2C truncation [Yersinia frederiksenii]
MTNCHGSVITSTFCPEVNPSGSSHLPLIVSCGGGFGLPPLGRSNWLFAGSAAAGERAARIMSLLETAKMNGLDPHAWLTDVLQRLPGCAEDNLDALLPLPGFTFGDRDA